MLLKHQEEKRKDNKEEQKISVERLKTYKGFEACTDQEAKEIINIFERFAYIICRHVQKSNLL